MAGETGAGVVGGYTRAFAPLIDSAVSYAVPTTGFNLTPLNTVSHLQLIPAGALLTGSIVLPDNPADGQLFSVSSSQTVTTLSVTASAGESITNAPITLVGGTGFQYCFRASNNTWYRRY